MTRIGSALGATLLLSCACLASGCAFVEVDVHPPDKDAWGKAFSSNAGRGREVILVAPFGDVRVHDRCGMQKNGYNMDTADVKCRVNPRQWFPDALALELTRSGFKVLRADAVPGPSTVVIRGVVEQAFFEPVNKFFSMTVEGDFAASLTVTTLSGLKAERRFYVKGTEDGIASTEGTFQTAADDATKKLAKHMVIAITELLDRYPALGAPEASGATRTSWLAPTRAHDAPLGEGVLGVLP